MGLPENLMAPKHPKKLFSTVESPETQPFDTFQRMSPHYPRLQPGDGSQNPNGEALG